MNPHHILSPRTTFLAITGLFLINVQTVMAADNTFSLSGSYRNLYIYSRTTVDEDRYHLDSNRLRIEAKGELSANFSYHIQYDNHLLFGEYLSTGEFAALEAARDSLPSGQYWNLEHEIKREDELIWDHSIYRGYALIRQGDIDLTIGRQRVPWGKGGFWSPLDMFNPLSPTAIERDERDGVDAALLTISGGTVSSLSLLYIPQRDFLDSTAARIVFPLVSYDIAVSAGRHMERGFAGLDFAGYLGDGGFYGELVSIEDIKGDQKFSYLFSGNYNFESSLYIMVEYFKSGGAKIPGSALGYSGKEYSGIQISYDITPLTRWDNYLIVNLDDNSRFLSPALSYSLSDNMELKAGIQLFAGKSTAEYGDRQDIYYGDFSWYF
ncbi:MAG: hypothetical protein RQ824_05070 [bacterium]|nr:hypothetical protein [bacterium]